MKKQITLAIFLLITMIAVNVFAATKVSMEIVEENVCTINLNEESVLEKKIVESDLENHKVTLQLKVSNNSEKIIPSGELMIVIDSSSSMNEIVEGTTTRKDVVLNSANELVQKLLEANPETLKIGIVTFSSSSEKDDNGYLIVGTEADAQKVCDFTNDVEILKNKISSIQGTGQYTNLDAGLQLANKQFTTENTHKYMIVLTDGVPNLAVGNSELFSQEGINKNKTTLASMTNVEIMTMLTGVTNESANPLGNTYTYGQIIQEIFGTEEAPTNGDFYKISDDEIEQVISEKIYRKLLPVEKTLDNIKVVDYIPQYIVDNFEITLAEESAEFVTISEDKKTITWNIQILKPGESKSIKFNLVLKEEFKEEIVEKVLNTNEKVDITYDDFDKETKTESSEVTPKIKITKKDDTVTPEIIPEAGLPTYGFAIITLIAVAMVFLYKYKKI